MALSAFQQRTQQNDATTIGHIQLTPGDNNIIAQPKSGTVHLPEEVWDNILAQLDYDSATLKACNLACKALYHPARALLWQRVGHPEDGWERAGLSSTLKLALAERPILRTLIRSVCARLAPDDLPYVASFEHLTRLELINFKRDRSWQSPLPSYARFSSVTELVLSWYRPEYVSDLIWMLNGFPHLTYLEVSDSVSSRRLPEDFLPQDVLSLPYLREVVFRCPRLANALPAITRAAGASLRRLELRLVVLPPQLFSDILDLSLYPQLTNLALYLRCTLRREPWDERLLEALLVHVNHMHTSLIHLIIHLPKAYALLEPGVALGGELSRIMEGLPRVTITFCNLHAEAETWRETYAAHFRRTFPELSANTTRLRFLADYDLDQLDEECVSSEFLLAPSPAPSTTSTATTSTE